MERAKFLREKRNSSVTSTSKIKTKYWNRIPCWWVEMFLRLSLLAFIFLLLGVLVNFALGKIDLNSEARKGSMTEFSEMNILKEAENEQSRTYRRSRNSRVVNSNEWAEKTSITDQFMTPVDFFKGNDDDDYYISFKEIGPGETSNVTIQTRDAYYNQKIPRQLILPPEYHSSRRRYIDRFRRKRNFEIYSRRRSQSRGKVKRQCEHPSDFRASDMYTLEEHQRYAEKEINATFRKADDIATTVLNSQEAANRGLGVCRKSTPNHFLSMEPLIEAEHVIDAIVTQLRNSLEQTMGCHACVRPHPELLSFLKWLIHDDTSLKCCVKRPKDNQLRDNYLLFNHENRLSFQSCGEVTEKPNKAECSTCPSLVHSGNAKESASESGVVALNSGSPAPDDKKQARVNSKGSHANRKNQQND